MQSSKALRLILALAFVSALLAVGFAVVSLTRRPSRPAAPSSRVTVLIARQDIPLGAIIRPDMVTQETWASEEVPAGVIRLPQDVLGKVPTRHVTAGTALTQDMVADAGAVLGVASLIPPSLRAVTLPVETADGLIQFLRPGHRVDVLATFTRNENSSTQLIVQDAEVLMVGSTLVGTTAATNAQSGQAAATGGKAPVTLAVTVEQAARISLALSRAEIRLALRPADGEGFGQYVRVTETELSGLQQPQAPRAATPSASAPRQPVTRVTASPRVEVESPRPRVPETPAAVNTPRPNQPERTATQPSEDAGHEIIVIRGAERETVVVP